MVAQDTNLTIKRENSESCARYKRDDQIKGQVNLREIQTQQSNKRAAKAARNTNFIIK